MLRVEGNWASLTPGVKVPLLRLPPSGSKPGKRVKLTKSRPNTAKLIYRTPTRRNKLAGRLNSIRVSRILRKDASKMLVSAFVIW